MAHFAEIDSNNIVTRIVRISNDALVNPNTGLEDEEFGIVACRRKFGINTNWKQTSYNHNMRVRYAAVGYSYNEELDAFIPIKPSFESWILNTQTCNWESPLGPAPERTIEQIENHSRYKWDEEAYQADNTTGWVLETPEAS